MSTLDARRRRPLAPGQYASVIISGPGPHATISERVRLAPTEAWNVGDVNPADGTPRRSTEWILTSGLDDTHDIERHIRELLVVLGTREHELRSLWVDHDIMLACVGHFSSWTHGVHLDREVVRQAARLGLAIDFDFYFVDEEPVDVSR